MGKSKNNHLKLKLYNKVYEYNLNTLDGLIKLKASPWVNSLVAEWNEKDFNNYENSILWVENKDNKNVRVLRVQIVFCKRTDSLVDIKSITIECVSGSVDFEYSAYGNKYGLYTLVNPLFDTLCSTRKSDCSGVLSKEIEHTNVLPQNFRVGCNKNGKQLVETYVKYLFDDYKDFYYFNLAVI